MEKIHFGIRIAYEFGQTKEVEFGETKAPQQYAEKHLRQYIVILGKISTQISIYTLTFLLTVYGPP